MESCSKGSKNKNLLIPLISCLKQSDNIKQHASRVLQKKLSLCEFFGNGKRLLPCKRLQTFEFYNPRQLFFEKLVKVTFCFTSVYTKEKNTDDSALLISFSAIGLKERQHIRLFDKGELKCVS